ASREGQLRVSRYLTADVGQCDDSFLRVPGSAGEPPDRALPARPLASVGRKVVAVAGEQTKPPVGVAAVSETRNRLLSRVAALREADRALVETRFRGEHPG